MRIKKLEICAFGPFKETEKIDFTVLNNKNIFLITGPTGSGKTTIFDAISYALYGRSSGAMRKDPDNVRSHFASHDTKTYVEMIFEIRNNEYRIRRSPKQMRLKRGKEDEFTEDAHAVELYLPNQNVLTRVNEVNNKVIEIIGVNYDQFNQIVMLPQGEFQKLLNSSSENRSDIFRKIFRTEQIELFETVLKEETIILKEKVKDSESQLNAFYHQIRSEGSDELSILLTRDVKDPIQITLSLNLLNQINNKELVVKNDQFQLLINKEKELETVRLEKSKINDLISKLTGATSQKEQLTRHLPIIEERKRVVLNGENALKLVPFHDNFILIEDKIEAKQLEITKQEKTYHDLLEDQIRVKIEFDQLAEMNENVELLRNQKNTLNNYLTKLTEVISKKERQKTTIKARDEKLKLITLKVGENDNLSNEISKYNQQILNNSEIIKTELDVRDTLNRLINHDKSLKSLKDALNDFRTHETVSQSEYQNYIEFNKEYHIVRQKYDEVSDAYLSNQAALLASKLVQGLACPVCGSTEHPKKAEIVGMFVDEVSFKQAGEELQKAEDKKNKLYKISTECLATLHEKNIHINRMKDELEITGSHDEVNKLIIQSSKDITFLINDCQEKIKLITSLKKENDDINNYITKANKQIDSIKNDLVQLQSDTFKMEGTLATLSDEITRELALIPLDYHDLFILKADIDNTCQKLKKIGQRIELIKEEYHQNEKNLVSNKATLDGYTRELTQYKVDCKKISDEFQKLLNQSFNSYDEFFDSLIEEDLLTKHKQSIEQYKIDCLEIDKEIEMLKADIGDNNFTDLTIYREEIAILQNEQQLLNKKIDSLKGKLSINEQVAKNIETKYAEFSSLNKTYEQIRNLDDIARGKNYNRISFERYILSYHFNQIISVANQRLLKMTNGRYTLARKEEKSKGSAQQGLDLVVYDAYTTKPRDVSTLSGGETFKASLALALGLAEVVQGNVGGISLETIFVDEGFGTLDPDSLDIAIEVLMGINDDGRVVGVISHVEGLKERIEMKVKVEISNSGSTIIY